MICFCSHTEMCDGNGEEFSPGAFPLCFLRCTDWRWSLLWAGWKSILQVCSAAVSEVQMSVIFGGCGTLVFIKIGCKIYKIIVCCLVNIKNRLCDAHNFYYTLCISYSEHLFRWSKCRDGLIYDEAVMLYGRMQVDGGWRSWAPLLNFHTHPFTSSAPGG